MLEHIREPLLDLPHFLSNHLMLTVIALGVGVLISVPLAIWLTRSPRLQYPLLTAAGVIQTIPSLALLALMVPILAMVSYLLGRMMLGGEPVPDLTHELYVFSPFGFAPAIIALTLYSILPILRNTVTGITGVDPAMTEAARGMGMTDRQVLWKVQLPLAAPVIIAGIRTATVWIVGIATLSTPVGQTSLGNYIFAGLQTRNWTMVMFGVVAAALLAIILDLLIGMLQTAASERKRKLGIVAAAILAGVVVLGLVSPTLVAWTRGHTGPSVAVGAKTFTEQYILARLISGRLDAADLAVRRTESLGSAIIFDALSHGEIDVYVDYSGTIWANYMNRDDVQDPQTVLDEMNAWLLERHNIRNLGPLGFENAYALAMRRDQAEALNITSIADLARQSHGMRIGGDYEFFGRPEWATLRDTYNLAFTDTVSMDSSIMYQSVAQDDVQVIAAFSSDGRIAAYDLVVLDDPRRAIPPYDAILLLGPTVADDVRVIEALQPLVGRIDIQLMQQANQMVDGERRSQSAAARWLAEQIDIAVRIDEQADLAAPAEPEQDDAAEDTE